jgi:DNA-binding beta-propeller fold protein YncE
MKRLVPAFLALAAGLGVLPAISGAAPVGGDYVYTGSIDLGAPGSWDYASFDAAAGRYYVGHTDKVSVVDVASRKVVGSVGPMLRAHGAAILPLLGRGFATSGEDGMLKEFDLADLHIVQQISIGKDDDGIVADPRSGMVIVTVGDARQLVIVNAATAAVAHVVDLPGEPEFPAADGRGKAYVNVASTSQMAKVDIASGHLDAVWPLPGCVSPHGLAYDHRTGRLFTGCANSVLLVVDPKDGRILASLPTGPFSDAVAVDEARHRVFCPNGNGTLTVIDEGPNDTYAVLRTIPTFLGARSMTIDPRSGELFITYGDTQIVSGMRDPAGLRFGWAGAKVATFMPND